MPQPETDVASSQAHTQAKDDTFGTILPATTIRPNPSKKQRVLSCLSPVVDPRKISGMIPADSTSSFNGTRKSLSKESLITSPMQPIDTSERERASSVSGSLVSTSPSCAGPVTAHSLCNIKTTAVPPTPVAEGVSVHSREERRPKSVLVTAQEQTTNKCDQCLEKGRPCKDGQADVKSCKACKSGKQNLLCSFHPKFLCNLCPKFYPTSKGLQQHKDRGHKLGALSRPGAILSPNHPSSLPILGQNSPIEDNIMQDQDLHPDSQSEQSTEFRRQLRISQFANSAIYSNFADRIMDDDHVERSLDAIRREITKYEEFTRVTDPQYGSKEVELQFDFLRNVTPFTCLKDVQEETHVFFAPQNSRLLVLWREMFKVHPAARLRDVLIRSDLEDLKLPMVIRGTLAYVIFCTIFQLPDHLRSAERKAKLESAKLLYSTQFTLESHKHHELAVLKDKSVDREIKILARELAEVQFYDLMTPLTHWDSENPTTKLKRVHLDKLACMASKSLRLSRELLARVTEDYEYFWPSIGEPFRLEEHIDLDDSNSGERVVKWVVMFGVKASRESSVMVYAKAVVVTAAA